MKNAYATVLAEKKEQREKAIYKQGYEDGIDLTLNLVAIALNDELGIGGERMTRIEKRVQQLFDEVILTGDSDVNREHIDQRVREIRGAAYDTFGKEVLNK